MCGIVGVVAHTPVNQLLYDGLLLLQHRGQDAAGIVTSEGPVFHMYKGPGLVQNVFRTRNMRELLGASGIGHCRYPTAGSAFSDSESQPFYVNSPFRHHAGAQRQPDQQRGAEARVVGARFPARQHEFGQRGAAQRAGARARTRGAAPPARPGGDIQGGGRRAQALSRRLRRGGDDRRVRHARLPRSLRHPTRSSSARTSRWAAPSTSRRRNRWPSNRWDFTCCATWRPARPSSSTRPGNSTRGNVRRSPSLNPCIFEFVYLARPDSVIDGTSVYEARLNMGGALAEKIRRHAGSAGHRRGDPDTGFEPSVGARTRELPRTQIPRGFRQEPLHRPHVHHAGPGDAQEERAPEAQSDRHRVQGQGRAAGRRLDRARHDVAGRS